MPRPVKKLRLCVALAVCLGAIVIEPGCRGARRTRTARLAPAKTRAIETRVDAVPGQTLVVPVTLEGAIAPSRPLQARLDDGRRIAAPLFWVSATLPADRGAWSGWLEPAGEWSATPASASTRPSASGWWVVMLDLPLDSIGQGVWLNGERIVLNWMGEPSASASVPIEWRPVDEVAASASLLRLAAPDAQSPVRRWRYRLLTLGPDGLAWGMEGEPPPALGPGEGAFADPVLEAMARQDEARWAAALNWLWLADADLAERVRRRLVTTVDFGAGVVAPVWPTSAADLAALRDDLLNPWLGPAARAERALAWLHALPPAAAWVVDDAGLRGPDGRVVASFGVANLADRATLAWATAAEGGAGRGAPDLIAVPSQEVRTLVAAAPESLADRAPSDRPRPAPFEVHAGRWATLRTAVVDAFPVAPPGLAMSPLLADWTMATFIAGTPDVSMVPEAEWAGAAMLSARVETVGHTSASRWWLHVECKSPPGEDGVSPARDETVRVWIGPPGRTGGPTAILRVSSRGTVVDERAMERAGEGVVAGAAVTRRADRWVCRTPIPAGAVEEDGTLMIGIERVDASGRRTAWPRALLPWQTEPGRVRVDTKAWGAVDGIMGVAR